MVRFYLGLLEGLDIPALPPSIELAAPEKGRSRAVRLLAERGIDPARPLVVLAPGAAHGPAKRWPAARFAETARRLMERRGAAVAVAGDASDAPLAAEIAAALPSPPADLTGKTGLGELLGLFSVAAVVVTNDSGPLHMANALRTPVVAVFGPTDPRATGPFHAPSRVVRREGVACWPCDYRRCPSDLRCMTGVSVDEATAAAEELLG
jgi:heptosyltransferase-2